MTIFNEAQHPRVASGAFTDKPQSVPETYLPADPIAGYFYRGEFITAPALLAARNAARAARAELVGAEAPVVFADVEKLLASEAVVLEIERDDERSFDDANFPKKIRESELMGADLKALGRPFWSVPGSEDSFTAADALDEWSQGLDLEEDALAMLWAGTDYSKSPARNLRIIERNAREGGLASLPMPESFSGGLTAEALSAADDLDDSHLWNQVELRLGERELDDEVAVAGARFLLRRYQGVSVPGLAGIAKGEAISEKQMSASFNALYRGVTPRERDLMSMIGTWHRSKSE